MEVEEEEEICIIERRKIKSFFEQKKISILSFKSNN